MSGINNILLNSLPISLGRWILKTSFSEAMKHAGDQRHKKKSSSHIKTWAERHQIQFVRISENCDSEIQLGQRTRQHFSKRRKSKEDQRVAILYATGRYMIAKSTAVSVAAFALRRISVIQCNWLANSSAEKAFRSCCGERLREHRLREYQWRREEDIDVPDRNGLGFLVEVGINPTRVS